MKEHYQRVKQFVSKPFIKVISRQQKMLLARKELSKNYVRTFYTPGTEYIGGI